MTVGPLLERLFDPAPLRAPEVRRLFDALVEPDRHDAERTALLVGWAARRAAPGELVLAALEMRRRALPFRLGRGDRPIDLCGSGGAARPSFNVSTVSAFVVAAGGVPVVKHGNRSARGFCGSSDLLEALGLPVTSSPAFASASYAAERIAFLHAPLYHPATAAVRSARSLLGIPTIFNRLGPLSNPARVPYQLVGAPDPDVARLFAAVLPRLGVRRGASMSSQDGCDEFSPRAPTSVVRWGGGARRTTTVRPARHLKPSERRGDWGPLAPSDAAHAAETILAGGDGARTGSVLLTSGMAFWIAGAVGTLDDGVRWARSTIARGSARALLERLRQLARGAPPGRR